MLIVVSFSHLQVVEANMFIHNQLLSHKTTKESSEHIFTTICCCVNNHKKPKLIILSLRSQRQLLGVFMQAGLLAVIRTREQTHAKT